MGLVHLYTSILHCIATTCCCCVVVVVVIVVILLLLLLLFTQVLHSAACLGEPRYQCPVYVAPFPVEVTLDPLEPTKARSVSTSSPYRSGVPASSGVGRGGGGGGGGEWVEQVQTTARSVRSPNIHNLHTQYT